jgi:hypothetical protein
VLEFENKQLKANSTADKNARGLSYRMELAAKQGKDDVESRLEQCKLRVVVAAWRDIVAALSTTLSSLIPACTHFRHPRHAVLDWTAVSSFALLRLFEILAWIAWTYAQISGESPLVNRLLASLLVTAYQAARFATFDKTFSSSRPAQKCSALFG